MTTKQKKNIVRLVAVFIMLLILHFIEGPRWMMFGLYMIPYLMVGYDILKKAGKGIVNRQPLDENLLMSVATLGAIVLALYRTGDFTEAVAVMLFYQVGEFFQSYAVGKSRRDIGELMEIRPDYANLESPDGVDRVDPDDVEIGSIIVVEQGEKIPLDGIVIQGMGTIDTSALTGESIPRTASEGDQVLSGCINMGERLRIRTTSGFEESTASKILDLVENASSRKSRSEQFISRFARIYTPVVVICAVILGTAPPLISMGIPGIEPMWGEWIYRALTFLVISCPCALVISIPLSFFAGIGGASREGILVKGSNYLEALSGIRSVAMDKTGTLTRGIFEDGVLIGDEIKETSPKAIEDLRRSGVKRIIMLSGDRDEAAERVAKEIGISEVYSQLLPAEKVEKLEQLMEDTTGGVAFVGDGINDAPVLARADIGIAMGALGTDAAIEAADVVLMDDDPARIAKAISISRKCMRIVRQNIVFAIGVKVACLLLCAVGLADMWLAIFADVGVMVLAVLNAIRAMFIGRKR